MTEVYGIEVTLSYKNADGFETTEAMRNYATRDMSLLRYTHSDGLKLVECVLKRAKSLATSKAIISEVVIAIDHINNNYNQERAYLFTISKFNGGIYKIGIKINGDWEYQETTKKDFLDSLKHTINRYNEQLYDNSVRFAN